MNRKLLKCSHWRQKEEIQSFRHFKIWCEGRQTVNRFKMQGSGPARLSYFNMHWSYFTMLWNHFNILCHNSMAWHNMPLAYWQMTVGRKLRIETCPTKWLCRIMVMTNFPYNNPTSDDILVNFPTYFVYNLTAMLLHHMCRCDPSLMADGSMPAIRGVVQKKRLF